MHGVRPLPCSKLLEPSIIEDPFKPQDSPYLNRNNLSQNHKGMRTQSYYSEVKVIPVKKDSEINVLDRGKIIVFLNPVRN